LFFKDEHKQFFRPLTGKYREVIVGCLKAFYDLVYGPNAEYGHHVRRDELRDIFVTVIQTTPVIDEAQEAEEDADFDDERKFAGEIIRRLSEYGWIEEFTDKTSLTRAYRFTRQGKGFASVFVGLDAPKLRTRQRNVRSARNSLEAFLKDKDPYDLIDAINYSRQISDDFNEDIAYLYDARRQLVRAAVENRAIDFFVEYTERVFANDIKIRFSADSVERHRARIDEIISEIRVMPEAELMRANSSLETMLPPDFGRKSDPAVIRALDAIEHVITASCDSKAQELRNALHGFVSRAKMLQHQAAMLSGYFGDDKIPEAVIAIADAADDPEKQDALLARAAREIQLGSVRLIDPATIRQRRRAQPKRASTITETPVPTREELRAAALKNATQAIFDVSPIKVKEVILKRLEQNDYVKASQLPSASVEDLLIMLHAIQAGSLAVMPEHPLTVEVTDEIVDTPCATFNEIIIRKAL
jgi:hypothetical protein